MGSKANRLRSKWQHYSGKNALQAEKDFHQAFDVVFEDTEFQIRSNPKEFQNIYLDIELSKEELSEIYTPPPGRITRHGIAIDYAIDNTETDKTIYVEIKRQDGWVEGGERKDGRGNAHERCCKFFTPGLQKIFRKQGNLGDDVLPFWVVFQGDITRDPCRVREITCWFDDYTNHFFFWRDTEDPERIFDHFENGIKPLLL